MANGWIILDKASGLFSRTAGGRIARMFDTKKFGHIGTLDPMASGVLPIALGDATKMIPFVEDAHSPVKEYLFSMRFGFETDSLDITGNVIRRDDFVPDVTSVTAVCAQFVGDIMQIPPAYSAVHIDGRRAYELARRGAVPDIPPRPVTIYELEFIGRDGPSWHFRTRCSRGTYVRSLARDIAAAAGGIATVDMIRRTETNGFTLKSAVTLDFLENLFNNGADIGKYLMPMDYGLGDIPVCCLDDKDARFYINGGFIETGGAMGLRRVYNGDNFIGVGNVTDGVLRPKRTI
ncbi:MAG: tRNA pseudouridine(55) synthase TruB [Alphaproteobacteria bacterium]|nr:tRNA pseudouridine(55) synthase TruB [Alphaproteobacteria bacterium]